MTGYCEPESTRACPDPIPVLRPVIDSVVSDSLWV